MDIISDSRTITLSLRLRPGEYEGSNDAFEFGRVKNACAVRIGAGAVNSGVRAMKTGLTRDRIKRGELISCAVAGAGDISALENGDND